MDSLTVGINKLTLRSGDLLVVQFPPDGMSQDFASKFSEGLASVLPEGVKTLILVDGVQLSVIRDGTQVKFEPPENDAPIMVTTGAI